MTKRLRDGSITLDDFDAQSLEVARQVGGLFVIRMDHLIRDDQACNPFLNDLVIDLGDDFGVNSVARDSDQSNSSEEELAKAEALLEKEEAMLKEGHQRLRQLLEEEKAMASPFARPPSAGLGVSTEMSRMQAIIDSLQGELARLRGSSAVGSGANGDELMSELPHSKKSRRRRNVRSDTNDLRRDAKSGRNSKRGTGIVVHNYFVTCQFTNETQEQLTRSVKQARTTMT